jgi:hypothetical protein
MAAETAPVTRLESGAALRQRSPWGMWFAEAASPEKAECARELAFLSLSRRRTTSIRLRAREQERADADRRAGEEVRAATV